MMATAHPCRRSRDRGPRAPRSPRPARRRGGRSTRPRRRPGGRCRTFTPPDGFAHDNGTHVLFTANRRGARLPRRGRRARRLDRAGARGPADLRRADRRACAGSASRPGPGSARAPPAGPGPRGPPAPRCASPSARGPAGRRRDRDSARSGQPDRAADGRRCSTPRGRRLLPRPRPGAAALIRPGRGAPPRRAARPWARTSSSRPCGSWRGGARRPRPASACAASHEGRAASTGLAFADRTVPLGPGRPRHPRPAAVRGGAAPARARRCRTRFEPIVNVHYRMRGLGPPALRRLLRDPGAMGARPRRPRQRHRLGRRRGRRRDGGPIWRPGSGARSCRPCAALGLAATRDASPEARVVKEKRATIRQAAGRAAAAAAAAPRQPGARRATGSAPCRPRSRARSLGRARRRGAATLAHARSAGCRASDLVARSGDAPHDGPAAAHRPARLAARLLRRRRARDRGRRGRARADRRPVYVRHEIVHNGQVVDDLKRKGAIFVDEHRRRSRTGPSAIFSAHGVPRAVEREAARARALR